jgi:hypothetical protein
MKMNTTQLAADRGHLVSSNGINLVAAFAFPKIGKNDGGQFAQLAARVCGTAGRVVPASVCLRVAETKMATPVLEPKTISELQQIIADRSGLKSNLIRVHRLGLEGNFRAIVIGQASAAQQPNVEAICENLRLKYSAKG